jgi:hypothetical protein
MAPNHSGWPVGDTRVVKTLAAGAPGTARWSGAFGDNLVCVRHRHDVLKLVRYTTAEIVVDARPQHPRRFARAWFGLDIPADPEPTLRTLLETHGGRWDARERVWRLRGDAIWQLGLVPCIVAL